MTPRHPGENRCTHVRWLIVAMLMMIAFLGHFNRLSISVAGSERFIRDQLIDKEAMGRIYTAFLWAYTFCMMPAGWFIDRVGPMRALFFMLMGMGFCVALTGAVGWMGLGAAGLWLSFMVVRSVAGIASTPLHPGAARSVSLWMPAVGRTWANGMVTAGALLGIAASYPVFGWLMDRFDWPAAFVICGGVMMGFAVVWRLLATDHARDHRWANEAEGALVSRAFVPGGTAETPRGTLRDFFRLFKRRGLVLISVSYGAVGYFQYLFFYWIEHYFQDTLKLSDERSRNASAIVMVAMAVGMACGGWVSDLLCRRWGMRIGRRTIVTCGMFLSAGFGVLGLNAMAANNVTLWFALAMGSLGMCEGVFWTTVTEIGGRTGGLAAAFMNTLGNGLGAVAPALTPVLADDYGWGTAFGVACGVCAVGGVLWFMFDPVCPEED